MIDDGNAIAYGAVTRGTPVYGSDEVEVGTVDAVLDNYKERIFDGIIFKAPDGELRFADAPEVARTAERGVTLSITAAEAGELPHPEKAAPKYGPNLGTGRLNKAFGRGWKRR